MIRGHLTLAEQRELAKGAIVVTDDNNSDVGGQIDSVKLTYCVHAISAKQPGFRKERSTKTLSRILLVDVKGALATPRNPLCVMSNDIEIAFDSESRNEIMLMVLPKVAAPMNVLERSHCGFTVAQTNH